MRKINKCLIGVLTILGLLSGCASPDKGALAGYEKYLSPPCYALITDTSFSSYQSSASHPLGRAVFAIANEGNKQVCAYSSTRADLVRNWDTLDVLALGKCEKERIAAGMTSTCKVFSRNFEVIWGEKKNYGME